MNQKLEDILNLALETPEEERARTETLNVGFDSEQRTWELIVKYHGSLDALDALEVTVEYLIAGYAILTMPENLVNAVAELEQIEYVEKSKRFFFSQVSPTGDRCFPPITMRAPFLTGEGVLLAVLDSGIDWTRPDFREENGETRIVYLWDQTLELERAGLFEGEMQRENSRRPPAGFTMGVEFDARQINAALTASTERERYDLLPSRDVSGHGTAVAGIAAGFDQESGYSGAAPGAALLIVKLGLPGELGFPRTTEIMRGITYALIKANELQLPLAINLSFGNNYGSHDGSSLLERFLDNAAEIGRTVICVGSGNEGDAGGHVAGDVRENDTVELAVGEYEQTLNVQIWKNYSDVYRIFLRSPGGQETELPFQVESGKYTLELEQTRILVYIGEPRPYAVPQEIYLDMLPREGLYINSGVWSIRMEPVTVVTGRYYFYLPGSASHSSNTRFFQPTPEVTLTIPSTAAKVITVGAYNFFYDSYAEFSGRGYSDSDRTIGAVTAGLTKPDLVASGVDVLAPDTFGGYITVTGTSFATPIVTGSAALLMEWGIVRGNDPFLYGEKVKAYLRKGARPLRGEAVYPNERVGWGALCVAESLPI